MTKRRLVLWISVICLLAVLIPGTALAVTAGWDQNSDGTWSYYTSSEPNSYYRSGMYEIYDESTWEYKWYAFDATGRMLANKWYQQDGAWYYFGADGARYQGGVYKIGSAYYGFDWEGQMFDNTAFEIDVYDEEGYWMGWGNYRAKKGGQLCVNSWYQDGSDWYYYGEGGLAAEDFKKIGNTWYFFSTGYMVTNELVYSGIYERYYIISASGTSSTAVPTKGWFVFDGGDYYIDNGDLYVGGVYKIGSAYYGFNWDGRMFDNEAFEMDEYDEDGDWIGWKQYRAKKGGRLIVSAWHKEGNEWYYYGADGAAPRGYTKIGNTGYYFGYGGRMYTSVCEYVDGVYYAFGEDGKHITTTGKQDIGSYYVYVNADGTIVTNDWVKIGGNWHYFRPEMEANTVTEIDGILYAVNNAGACTAVTGNGIYDIGIYGKVYIENGKIVENAWKQVGGAWYYFNYSMCRNGVHEIDGELYVFDQNGKMFTGGWLLLGESYYKGYGEEYRYYVYADPAGKAATGVKTISGQQYVFNDWGYMYADTTVTIKGVTYVIGKTGAVIKTIDGNGWKQIDGKWYYVENGQLVTEEIRTIGGKKYAFDYNGVMITNQTYWVGSEGRVLAKADGTLLVNGWTQFNNAWYYADADGILAEEVSYTIGGKTYYFEYGGTMRTGTFMYDGMIITTNASGVVVSEKDPAAGWTYVDGRVLYYKNGMPYDGWVGDYLILGGEMAINDYWDWEGDWYAFDEYGKYVKKGWHQFNYGIGKSDYVYAKAGGKLCCDEWLQLGGKWYYFDYVYMLSDGSYYVDGQLCRFDANGVYLGNASVSGSDGWKKSGSDWYYIHAGETVSGVRWIEGKRYVFEWNGVLQTNGYTNLDGTWYYTDANGAIPNYTGWKKISGEWCYFNSSNLPVVGWLQDGGKEYHIEPKFENGKDIVGMTVGYHYNEGQLYYFDSNGVCKGTRGVQNGWYQAGGEWYYFINGTAVNDVQNIGGKQYYFINGAMVSNTVAYDIYYGANGVARTSVGWYQIGKYWIYVMDNTGKLANGVQKIGGKEYFFSNCFMVR